MKRITVFVIAVLLMCCLSACVEDKSVSTENDTQPVTTVPEISVKEIEQRVSVFDTENIKRITIITKYGYGEKIDVPDEDMAVMIAWLGTFTLDEVIDENIPVAPGTNTNYLEIEYADGTIIKNGFDTTTVDGVSYYMESYFYPDCLCELLNLPVYSDSYL